MIAETETVQIKPRKKTIFCPTCNCLCKYKVDKQDVPVCVMCGTPVGQLSQGFTGTFLLTYNAK